ncbi:hypothetical protein GGS23DRAFT_133692 [Durotheca rogersii]|uniref:uncharacterized protein n=1 Tax=Durotheca rogersii TaxID=419775 RepID=UPI00221FFBC0|nr:uncharacterized protein GGS23DRAFT_133692 [Durotheca rogersii]KAI5861834.1 hypothetical protein GGS23DRAFT_133692 [Durotheca rogersii]
MSSDTDAVTSWKLRSPGAIRGLPLAVRAAFLPNSAPAPPTQQYLGASYLTTYLLPTFVTFYRYRGGRYLGRYGRLTTLCLSRVLSFLLLSVNIRPAGGQAHACDEHLRCSVPLHAVIDPSCFSTRFLAAGALSPLGLCVSRVSAVLLPSFSRSHEASGARNRGLFEKDRITSLGLAHRIAAIYPS